VDVGWTPTFPKLEEAETMAQTETRPGFRLPWGADRNETDQSADEAPASAPEADVQTPAEELSPDMIDLKTTAPAAARRPTKFMADLSRAMQAAAESSRDETMARLTAEAKTVVEEIHAASTEEGASLRRRADDDVAAVREWSKGEIARIREETEARIATRKTALDGEMDAHAQVVEARVQQVATTISEFEAQMAEFFERLHAEEDPTRIATMAEAMPDPPDLANIVASIAEPAVEPFDPGAARLALLPEAAEPTEAAPEAGPDFAAAEAEALAYTGDEDGEAAAVATDENQASESENVEAGATEDAPAEAATEAPTDDASALAASDEGAFGSPAPAADAAVDQPAESTDAPASTERVMTRVVVLGLVSVASIATFKRSLGRTQGVAAIGVASGPDGEFVFTVTHDSGLALRDAITALPGFDARVTGESDGGIDVTAHDPDGD
jgi:hypothetical protein